MCIRSILCLWFLILGLLPEVHAADCNRNGVEDAKETTSGAVNDCNGNRIPDECEFLPPVFGTRHDTLALAGAPRVLAAGDFDRDGRLDLAVGNGGSRNSASMISILFGADDDGAPFLPGGELNGGRGLAAMATGDFDDDGDLDLVTANSTLILSLLENDGAGSFEPLGSVESPKPSAVVVAGDISGNGRLDLALSNVTTNSVTVLINEGAWTFEPAETNATVSTMGRTPHVITLSDVDGDADLDLIAAHRRSQDVAVLLNTAGTLGEAVRFPTVGRTPSSIVTGDLDGDGLPDLTVATSQAVEVLTNQGGGVFSSLATYELPGTVLSLITADFDGDGDPDIGAGVSLSESRAVSFLVHQSGGILGEGTTIAVEANPNLAHAGDFDRDGDADVAVVMASRTLRVLWNHEPGGLPLAPTSYFLNRRPHGADLRDVDLDGYVDLITGNGGARRSITLVRSQPDGSFSAVAHTPSDQYVNSLVIKDMDGDGDLDVVTADLTSNQVWVLKNDGSSSFPSQRAYPTGNRPGMVALGDVNGDGAWDAVTANLFADTVSLHQNDGNGEFLEDREDLPVGPINQSHSPTAVAIADLDGDGDADLAVSNSNSRTVVLLLNLRDAGGGFASPHTLTAPAPPDYVVAADLDADGDLDLVAVSDLEDLSTVYLNQGNATFATGQSLAGGGGYSASVADVDQDGLLDLIPSRASTGTFAIVPGSGDGTFRGATPYQVGGEPRFAMPGDLENDGDIDFVTANRTTENFTAMRNQSATAGFEETSLRRICTERDFYNVSVLSRRGTTERSTKYIAPVASVEGAELLPTLFQNVRRHALHEEFLRSVFPERFPTLSSADYNLLVGRRATRTYYAGSLNRLRLPGESPLYGFSVVSDASDPTELLTMEEVATVYERLSASFTLGPLGYAPDTSLARQSAERWSNPPFPVYLDDGSSRIAYEAYTRGVGYGRVRLLDEESFRNANERGEISFQSILVLSFAPQDIEGVVAGVITADTQAPLRHLAIRTARRRTPNAFVADAAADFSAWEGKLVRLEVQESEYVVEEATVEEAEAWWAENRPQLSVLLQPDAEFAEFSSLEEIAASDLVDGAPRIEARFGSKAAYLARLGRILGPGYEEYRERGIAVPMLYYFEFMRTNRMPSAIDPARQATYEEHLRELLRWPEFHSDPALRFRALENFRAYARDNGVVGQASSTRLRGRIEAVFSSSTPVRFRPSSNVEAALEFNGAGLYASARGCVLDTLDDNLAGPSLCDPSALEEQTIERALKEVWMSLWTFRAYEERAFYGVDQEAVGMGVLISRAFLDPSANGVALTGSVRNPLDKRYVVTVQAGDASIVSPDPGVDAEKDLLEMEAGSVKTILRPVRGSSLVPPGTWVLSDEQLQELGRLMAHIDERFSLELGEYRREELLLDLQFKIEASGELAVEQVRPFLLTVPLPPTPTFELEIPEGLMACGVFNPAGVDRGPREEYELKSQIRLQGGTVALPTASENFAAELVEELSFGPQREVATAQSSGLFRVVRIPAADDVTVYRFSYEQEFSLADGREILFRTAPPLELKARAQEPLQRRIVIDDQFLTALAGKEAFEAVIAGAPVGVRYGPCDHSQLERWVVDAALDDGSEVYLEERWDPQDVESATGPASLVFADVTLAGERRVVSDYWRLVYSAFRHNRDVRYWVVFEEPIEVPGLVDAVHALEVALPDAPGVEQVDYTGVGAVRHLGEDFQVLKSIELPVSKANVADTGFLRGDADLSGRLNILDPIVLLGSLFRAAAPTGCEQAADANADGLLNIADALLVLHFLYRDGPAPQPRCGPSETPTPLSCHRDGPCV